MNFIDQDLDDSWECPTCLQPFPPHHDYECGTCEAKASEHLRVTAMCRLLREVSGREAALIVERDKLKQQLSAERALADRLAGLLELYFWKYEVRGDIGEISKALAASKEARSE